MASERDAIIAHVVGQGLVALALGCDIHFDAEPDGSASCWIRNPAGGELPAHVLRPVGVAGPLAEEAFRQGSPDTLDAATCLARLQSGAVPLSPLAEGFTPADVDFALEVLQERWPILAREVAEMGPRIANGTDTFH